MVPATGIEERERLALDILKNFPEEGALPLYELALKSQKQNIRGLAVRALVCLGTAAAIKILQGFFGGQELEAQKDIILSMGSNGRHQAILDFLSEIKDFQNQSPNRKEISDAISKVKKRMES
jgi:HEAT repeat protein